MARTRRRLDASAWAATLPVIALVPLCLASLALFWLLVRVVWDVSYVAFVLVYLAAGVVLFLRPVQRYLLGPLLGARKPDQEQAARLKNAWRSVLQRNRIYTDRYMMMVARSEELNAYACGGHLLVISSYAVDTLPRQELAGVLAHELSHHLGLHTVALTAGHWLAVPTLILAQVGYFLRNVAAAATGSFARSSAVMTAIGRTVTIALSAVSWPFLAGLRLSTWISNRVGKSAEFQADRRAVDMGFGRELAAALRRAERDHGSPRTERAAGASHPSARLRIRRIEAVLRSRAQPDPIWGS